MKDEVRKAFERARMKRRGIILRDIDQTCLLAAIDKFIEDQPTLANLSEGYVKYATEKQLSILRRHLKHRTAFIHAGMKGTRRVDVFKYCEVYEILKCAGVTDPRKYLSFMTGNR